MNNLVIYGAGDVGKFVAWNPDLFGERYHLLGMVDDDREKVGGTVCGLPVRGREWLEEISLEGVHVLIAISSPAAKARIAAWLGPRGVVFPSLVARSSWISRGVALGRGTLIWPLCSIEHETEIGEFVSINAGCTVGHNVRIGNFSTLSPGVHLGGFTSIAEGSFLGIGCCTRQGVEIGARTVVGGQAMVTANVGDDTLVVGVPGKVKQI